MQLTLLNNRITVVFIIIATTKDCHGQSCGLNATGKIS